MYFAYHNRKPPFATPCIWGRVGHAKLNRILYVELLRAFYISAGCTNFQEEGSADRIPPVLCPHNTRQRSLLTTIYPKSQTVRFSDHYVLRSHNEPPHVSLAGHSLKGIMKALLENLRPRKCVLRKDNYFLQHKECVFKEELVKALRCIF